jgi:peptidoglycan/xylan/chitin deacetylase (PgdA/CDA1 family)
LLALLAAAAWPTLAACTSTAAIPPGVPDAAPTSSAWQEEPEPSPTVSPTPSPSPSLSPSAAATTARPPATLADYLARIPKFGAAPTPSSVTLSHTAGHAAFAYEIPTTQPVAFLTIDDGVNRHPMALDLIRAAKIPVTLFLTTRYVSGNQDYFRALRDTGYATIENHTITHTKLTTLDYSGQKHELCGASDQLAQWYGRRPVLFRPPYGERNDATLAAAWDCGLKAGFYWRETVDAGNVYYQRPDHKIHAGDIILMHFRPAFPDDFIAALTAIKNSGLTPALLEDYVVVQGALDQTTPPPAA